MSTARTLSLMLALCLSGTTAISRAADAIGHFDPKGKPPSTFTLELRNGLKAELPFDDKRDFDEAKKGFIAEPPYKQIMADAGHVAWDMDSYQWLLSGQDFASIHPSLQRQAVLNMAYGLYEVVPGRIYQVRGFDLANISFIKGDTGWIVFDPLTATETARAALEFDQREARQAAGGRRRLLAFARRSLRRRARRGGRGRRRERQGDGDRGRGLHGRGDLRERVRRRRRCRAACNGSTPCCCSATRTATSTRRSARTWPMAVTD